MCAIHSEGWGGSGEAGDADSFGATRLRLSVGCGGGSTFTVISSSNARCGGRVLTRSRSRNGSDNGVVVALIGVVQIKVCC